MRRARIAIQKLLLRCAAAAGGWLFFELVSVSPEQKTKSEHNNNPWSPTAVAVASCQDRKCARGGQVGQRRPGSGNSMEKFKIYGPPISEKDDTKVYKVRIKESIEFVALKSYKRDRLHTLQHAVQLRCTLRVRPSAQSNGPPRLASQTLSNPARSLLGAACLLHLSLAHVRLARPSAAL